MRPHVSGVAYQNYIDSERGTGRACYGSSYKRLFAIKLKYDPTTAFRFRQSIR